MKLPRCSALPWISVCFSLALVASLSTRSWAQPAAPAVESDRVLLTEPTGELKTMAVVAIQPYADVVNDLTFLGTLAGKPELGQMVEGGFAFFTQGKGPAAIDKTKPFGLIVQTDGSGFSPIVCLPVNNPDDLIGIATAYGAKLSDEDGIKTLTFANDKTMSVATRDGWAFVSQSPASLENLPKTPEASLGKLLKEYDVVVKIAAKHIPEAYRQYAIQAMQAGMEQQLVKKENESDEQFESRKQVAHLQMEQMQQLINEIDTMSLGWTVDAEGQRTFLDFTYLVKPGTKLADQLAAYEDTRTNFAGFYQPDAAATATMAMKADPAQIEKDIAQFNAGMQTMRDQFNRAVDENEELDDEAIREAVKSGMSDWFDALEATMKAGRFDGGASVQLSPDSMTLVAGALVKDPQKIEDGLKKMDEAAQKKNDPKYPGIQWNAASHDGINFHTLTVPVPEEEDGPRRLLGEQAEIAVGIGKDAVYLAVGRNNMDAVKAAIDASAKDREKSVPPFEAAVSLGPILAVAATKAESPMQQAILENVAEMLKSEAAGRDHVRIVGSVVPNGLRYRLEAEEGVLRAIGKATEEAQRQALEAQQQQ